MVDNIKADPDFTFGETGQTIPVYVKKPRGWKIEWMGPRKIGNREGFDPEAELVNFNELALKRVQQSRLETANSVWEVAHFYLPSPVVANNRPFYPKMLAIIERGSGFAVGAEMISPETDPMKAMKDLILQKMAEYKYIPSAIVSDDFWVVLHLRILSEKLNIATTQDELQNMGEFVEAIFTKAEDDLA